MFKGNPIFKNNTKIVQYNVNKKSSKWLISSDYIISNYKKMEFGVQDIQSLDLLPNNEKGETGVVLFFTLKDKKNKTIKINDKIIVTLNKRKFERKLKKGILYLKLSNLKLSKNDFNTYKINNKNGVKKGINNLTIQFKGNEEMNPLTFLQKLM